MKYAFALAAVAGLASASAHGHHQKLHRRDGVATVTDWTVVTVTDVVTVYGPSPSAQPSAPAPVVSSPQSPASSSSSAAAVTTTQAAIPNIPAPAPTTLQTVTSQAAKPQPAASSSSPAAPVVPTTPTAAAPAPAHTSSTAPTGGSGVGNYGLQAGASVPANCSEGTPCSGDMTTYTPGMGSCGYDDTTGAHADDAVALQSEMFGSLSNSGVNSPSNKLCGKTITIVNKATGETAQGTIRDKCPGCTAPSGGAGIDLAPALMEKLNNGVADGRLPITWYFTD